MIIKEHQEVLDHVIQVLNEALAADPVAINALMHLEVPCNVTLSKHPTIQIGHSLINKDDKTGWVMRPLGLINGLLGVKHGGKFDNYGFIAMNIDDDGRITEFAEYDMGE